MNVNDDDPELQHDQSEQATPKLYDKSSTAEVQGVLTAITPQCSEHWNDSVNERKDNETADTSTVRVIKNNPKSIINGSHSGSIIEASPRNLETACTSLHVALQNDTRAPPESASSTFSELVSSSEVQRILADNASSIEIKNGVKDGKSPSKKSSTDCFVHDPSKIAVKFLFANRDGIHVLVKFNADDTVRDMKGALIQAWPDNIPPCCDIDAIRLICMGRGVLTPDSRTLKECGVPVFETHATPVNVSVRPYAGGHIVDGRGDKTEKKKRSCVRNSSDSFSPTGNRGHNRTTVVDGPNHNATSQGCACVLL